MVWTLLQLVLLLLLCFGLQWCWEKLGVVSCWPEHWATSRTCSTLGSNQPLYCCQVIIPTSRWHMVNLMFPVVSRHSSVSSSFCIQMSFWVTWVVSQCMERGCSLIWWYSSRHFCNINLYYFLLMDLNCWIVSSSHDTVTVDWPHVDNPKCWKSILIIDY